jgi:hypothetical protein
LIRISLNEYHNVFDQSFIDEYVGPFFFLIQTLL